MSIKVKLESDGKFLVSGLVAGEVIVITAEQVNELFEEVHQALFKRDMPRVVSKDFTRKERVFTPEQIERSNAILHPTGRCTCWGEGHCALCRQWEAELEREDSTDALRQAVKHALEGK